MTKSLRSKLSIISRGMRGKSFSHFPTNTPLSTKSDTILLNGKVRKRKRIVMLTVGCGVGTCTMCPFPSESSANVNASDLIIQFENSFASDAIENYEVITIFCNGNFFRDKEIPPSVRKHIYQRIAEAGTVNYLVVESLPQFINQKTISEIKENIGRTKVCVCIGLQSSDDFIREVAVNTSCTKDNFENAVKLLLDNSFIPEAFVMIKPPFLTEVEAIEDSVNTLKYLAGLGVSYSILCPTRVAPNTLLETLYNKGFYEPLNIWSVVEVLKKFHDIGIGVPMVNTTELKAEKNTDSICAKVCSSCYDKIIYNLEKFLFTRDFRLLDELECSCKHEYELFKQQEQLKWNEYTIEERIDLFLQSESL